jgi:hypothetical protein
MFLWPGYASNKMAGREGIATYPNVAYVQESHAQPSSPIHCHFFSILFTFIPLL